jgi:hypothetical protein
MRVMRNACEILVRSSAGKRLIGKLRHRYNYNMKMDVTEMESGDVDWFCFDQDSVQWCESESWWCQEFSLLHVIQTGSGVHPTYPMGTRGSFLGAKVAEA